MVVNALEFGNSWKVSPSCPDKEREKGPCAVYSYRQAWAVKHCSIINSDVFKACHLKVITHTCTTCTQACYFVKFSIKN